MHSADNNVQHRSKWNQPVFSVEINFTGNRNTHNYWSQFKAKFSCKLLCVWGGCNDDGGSWTTIHVVQLIAEVKQRLHLVEQMRDSVVTLMIRHCAGSSASAIVTGSQLGKKVANSRAQVSLHMRTLPSKRMERKWGSLGVSPRSWRRGDVGDEERSRSMGKSPRRWLWKDGKRWEGWKGCIRRGRWCPWVQGGWQEFLQRLLGVGCK